MIISNLIKIQKYGHTKLILKTKYIKQNKPLTWIINNYACDSLMVKILCYKHEDSVYNTAKSFSSLLHDSGKDTDLDQNHLYQ